MRINEQAEKGATAAIEEIRGQTTVGLLDGLDITCELEWTGAVIHDGGNQEWYGISAMHTDDRKRHTVWVGSGGDIMTDDLMRDAQEEQYGTVDGLQTSRITTTDELLESTAYDVVGSRAWVVAQLEREGWQTTNINSLCTVLMHPAMGLTFKMVR